MKGQKQQSRMAACSYLSSLPQREREQSGEDEGKREDVQLRPNQSLLLVWGGGRFPPVRGHLCGLRRCFDHVSQATS